MSFISRATDCGWRPSEVTSGSSTTWLCFPARASWACRASRSARSTRARQGGKGVSRTPLPRRPVPAAALPDPAGLILAGPEADVLHQPRDRLRLEAERGDQRLVDDLALLSGAGFMGVPRQPLGEVDA